MSEYLLLLRGGYEPYEDISPGDLEAALQRYRDWANDLRRKNQLVSAAKLSDAGGRLRKTAQGIQVDGPFIETKEAIGGFFIVKAQSLDNATQLAESCPIFDEGGFVEIREIQT